MNTLPIIQTFFDKPVRFFEAEFTPEMHSYNGNASPIKKLLETWAIPLPDYARAIGYPIPKIFEMIKRNIGVFEGFYRTEPIPDSLGRMQQTIIMAVEMCDGLNMKLHTTRLKDPNVREMVTRFQRWVLFAFHLIRTGKLRGVRWNIGKEIPSEILRILSLPSGRETSNAVKEFSEKEGISKAQGYHRLQQVRGSNSLTVKGIPKRSPSFKGTTKHPAERQKALAYKNEHPKAGGKEIKEKLGVIVSRNTINTWIRLCAA